MRRAGVGAECVVFTSTPNADEAWEPLTRYLGEKLGVQVALVDGEALQLQTLDQSHLNKPSAERFSAAVLAQIAPTVDRCTGQAQR